MIFVYFIVIHLSMVIGEWLSSFMVSVVWTKFTHIPFIGKKESSTYKRGRITLNGWAFGYVVGAKSASWRSGVCDAIRPHRNLPMLQIRPHRKFTHISNHPRYKFIPYFQFSKIMDGRIAIRPYTCVIRTLANIM